ncbi:MAG: hypothetical protein KJ072_15700 [Verrucomicrobia bacterium]|nr:hypothetical protein [Verrucomicrobiota bacterium]
MSTETLFGGAELEVNLVAGGTEKVFVRQFPIRLMPQMLTYLENESRLVELFCDKPEGWSDSITVESFERVVQEGERLNTDFFIRWFHRRLTRQEKVMPGITEKLVRNAGLPLPTGSPNAPSVAA